VKAPKFFERFIMLLLEIFLKNYLDSRSCKFASRKILPKR
jgi:hypothetical protein